MMLTFAIANSLKSNADYGMVLTIYTSAYEHIIAENSQERHQVFVKLEPLGIQ